MRKQILFILIVSNLVLQAQAQNEPILMEAESGTLGSDFAIGADGDITYIAPKTNRIDGNLPGSPDKVASYSFTFPDSGTYKLFVRLCVGPESWDDDSYFYGNGFGTKDPNNANDWIMCNGLAEAGYSYLNLVVEGQGDGPTEIFKWVAFSDFTGGEDPITFRVDLDELTKTFQIGSREDGLSIDKIAFGREGLYYTVCNLDNGEPGSLTPPPPPVIGLPLAYGQEKFLGCGHSPGVKDEFKGYWNQVTPGNGGKWGSVESQRDVMDWSSLDDTYNFALENDFIFKHHVLVWGSQQPDWIEVLDSADQRAELEEWFSAVAERYPLVDQVEVVNEPLPGHNPPDAANEGKYIDALGGAGETGWDWILESFRMARNVFGDTTVLMINEYGILDNPANTDKYLEIIKLLQAEDLIDAIGFQGHGFSHNGTNEVYRRNIDSLGSTGLPVYVTELDIDGHTDLEQVHNYMNLFPLLWEHPSIKGITLWGYEYGLWRNDAGAYLVDPYGVQRPAFLWLQAYMKNEFVPNESVALSTQTGETQVDVDGILQVVAEVLPDTSTLTTLHWQVSNSSVATINQKGLLRGVSNGTVTVTAKSLELGSTLSDQIEITVGTGETNIDMRNAENDFLIYPNPAIEGRFTIYGLQSAELVTIYDVSGNIVKTFRLENQSEMEVNLSSLTGMYIVRVSDNEGSHYQKIVIQ